VKLVEAERLGIWKT